MIAQLDIHDHQLSAAPADDINYMWLANKC